MATKKFIELQEMSDEDLTNEVEITRQQLQKLRFDHAVKGLDNPLVLREIKRDIARLLGEQRRREIGALSEEEISKRDRIRVRRKN
jgi:large subunit ribosomal protein L29